MAKVRVAISVFTLIFIGIIAFIVGLFARGYRIEIGEDFNVGPTGILVANSEPQAAQVYVDGVLETATDNTISLAPATYSIEIKKEGYQTWQKNITIAKEAVTQIDAYLLPNAPSLTALTFSGAANPVTNSDNSKLVYVVPPTEETLENEKEGLWILESINLPLGFNRDPRQITNGDVTEATFEFSPDSREILMNLNDNYYLLDATQFTTVAQRVNVTQRLDSILEEWEKEEQDRLEAKLSRLPSEIEKVFLEKAREVMFSPDENRILFTASESAVMAEGLVTELPGSSTQVQERQLQEGSVYVYDIREDRNFKIADKDQTAYWLPNSLNLVLPKEDGIYVTDYDGTNLKKVFASSYTYPHAYTTASGNSVLILTNFASVDGTNNLYWLSLK